MNRRAVLKQGFWGIMAMIVATPTISASTTRTAQSTRFADVINLDPSEVKSAYARGFQKPSNSSPIELIDTLYWVVGLGINLRSGHEVSTVVDAIYPSLHEWYAPGSPSMRLTGPWEASVGSQIVGDGTLAWSWDVEDPEEEDEYWQTFAIGCVAVWSDHRLLLLWGCSARENPIPSLLDLASTAKDHWSDEPISLVPRLDEMPIGMLLLDEGSIASS